MAYRFNSGAGGVTCDKCNILYDANLGYAEYEKAYAESRKANGGKDLCWKCKAGMPTRRSSRPKG